MDDELLEAFRETSTRFARREIAAMVGVETRDGVLERVPDVLAQAELAGLLASPDPSSPGHEYGVWGRAADTEGAQASVCVLQALATECAGVAACVHFAGLGSAETTTEGPPVGVGMLGDFELSWSSIQTPPATAPRLQNGRLSGQVPFVYAPPGATRFVVYAAAEEGWARVSIEAGAGLTIEPRGGRLGLAALQCWSLRFDDAEASPAPQRSPAVYLRRLTLGLAAIAVGNAQGALRIADAYVAERYQGGRQIEEHAAVQLLLGDSRSRVASADATLRFASACEGPQALWQALSAKLRVTRASQQAVTDCMQVLGGYGYMEDYRIEKRLRDAMALTSMCLKPDTLRRLCAGKEQQ